MFDVSFLARKYKVVILAIWTESRPIIIPHSNPKWSNKQELVEQNRKIIVICDHVL